MKNSSTVQWLSKAIERATKSAKFCVAGSLPGVDPGLEVEGFGAVNFPLKRKTAKELVERCQVAPYGKGTETLINRKVRNTFELDPKEFRLSDDWNAAIAGAAEAAAKELGLPEEQIEARLYKLLVYEKGGFFLPHRDSEKHDRMVASMIVVLPNPFEGGMLVVRHGEGKQKLTFAEAASGKAPCYAAFYADCEHEVERVNSGVRVCLAYNLVLQSKRTKRAKAVKPAAPADALAESIGSWIAKQPGKPMVFALEHHYTQRGLSLDLLKGADRQLADLIVSAAEQKDCLVHLAQISRHLMQFADDGSFGEGYSRYYRAPRRKIEIGETYEDELIGTEWADSAGKKQPWGNIPFDLSTIVSSVPIDDWKPTKEEFEGYTGNAGNTLDRWYHRSALVVWHRDCHFEIVASSGAVDSIPLFCSMAAKLAKKPKKHFEAARIDCIRFARAIISRWPRSINSPGREKSFLEYFPEHLQDLHDRDTVALFLSKLAEQDQSVGLSSFILTACREFGWSTFSRELKQLILSRRETYGGQEIPLRDIEWLSAFSCDKSVDPDRSVLAKELCGLAVARFCEPAARRPAYHWSHQHRESSVSEKSVPLLLKGIVASGRNEDLSKVIQFVQGSPDEFRIDNCLVPCLKSLVPWSQRQFGSVHPQLMAWLSAVRQQLESATATEPTPPVDWTRPAKVVCDCQYCAQLNLFLADESNGVARIPAREEMRGHLLDMINRHQCDVKHTLDRRGSPHALVLTKTTGSFERAVKRFEANCRLLSELPGVE